tara:strand:+ start:2906 stop:4726 length:1821 start_codon:yes stop_codon:yes gene_type:complete
MQKIDKLVEHWYKTIKVLKEADSENILSWSSIPEIPVSEIGWSDMTTNEKGEEVPSENRAQLLNFLENIPGEDFKSKIEGINNFYKFDSATLQEQGFFGGTQASMISRIMAYLVFYKTLTTIITHFNAASAGFSFESFLGVLLGGKQIPTGNKTIADFTMADGTPVSLKLYAEKRLKVGGSYTDLVNDLVKDGKMQYIAVTKELSGEDLKQEGTLKFYRFNFNLDNVVNILAQSAGSESKRNIVLPLVYEDEIRNNPEFRIEDSLAGAGKLPSAEELEVTFIKELQDEIDVNEEFFANLKKKDGSDFDFEEFTQLINWAKDDEIFGAEKQRGLAQIRKTSNPLFNRFAETYRLGKKWARAEMYHPAKAGDVRPLIDIIGNATGRINARFVSKKQKQERGQQIKKAYFGKRGDLQGRSRALYNTLDETQKKVALLNSYGYIQTDQFDLNQNMVANIDEYAAPTPGDLFPEGQEQAEIGTIEIGASKVQEMLKNVTKILNDSIFDIFTSLKLLTTNIQGYFAGGLTSDVQADTAKTAASNIEKKTEKIQKGDVEGGQAGSPLEEHIETDKILKKYNILEVKRFKVRGKDASLVLFENNKKHVIFDDEV